MRSLIPASWQSVSGCPFLLAVLLAGPRLQRTETLPSSPQVTALGSRAAARLLIHVAKPDYPAIAKVNFIQGRVKLEITVNPGGKVVEVHVMEGEPLLAAAAFKAVRKWLYRPYVAPGGPAPFSTDVVINFALHPRTFGGRFPENAEGDLEKQVHPPEVVARPHADPSAVGVRLRVLVDSEGKVLDAVAIEATGAQVELARKDLRRLKFRPAHWGSLAIPWYVIVKVPLEQASRKQAANSAKHSSRIAP